MSELRHANRDTFDLDRPFGHFMSIDQTDENADPRNVRDSLWENYFSGTGLSSFDGLELDDMGGEKGDFGTSDLDSESVQALLGDIPGSRRKKKKESISGRITEEDFPDGPERTAFTLVRDRARACYHKISRVYDQVASLRWVFSASMDNEISLDLACSVLQARPDAIRVRVQVEFYERMITFDEKLPGFLHPVPFFIRSAGRFHDALYGEDAVTAIWEKPSILTTELLSVVPSDTLNKLSAKGIIAQQLDRWYILGRGFF